MEILGQVYEQFLGKVIRLTAGHQAKVEEKPEVRKAGGVYYTPNYIVDYIVQNTVGKLLEGKTPDEAASLKIVDPACGSGRFCWGHSNTCSTGTCNGISHNDPEKWAKGKNPALVQASGGGWKLTTAKKKDDLAQQHPRRGYRRTGGGSDQAEPAAESAGRGKRAVEPGV